MPSIKGISASLSTISAPSTAGTGIAVPVSGTFRWTDNTAAAGIPAAGIVLSSSGASNTLVQPSGVTDNDGEMSGATYAGSTSGARTLTVTVRGTAMDDQPVVTVGGGLADSPNAPGGMTGIVDQPLNTLLFTDSGVTWLNGASYPTPTLGTVSIITDSSAPESPSSALRWDYEGVEGGNGPAYRECSFGEAYSALFTTIWIRPSVGWEDHPSGVNKLFYWTARNTPNQTGTAYISLFFNSTANPTGFRFITQNPGIDQEIFTTSGFTPVLGEWHRIEVLQERTSGILGRVRIWCSKESNTTPVLALDQTGVQLTDSSQTLLAWNGIVMHPVWGGTGSVASSPFYLDLDHIFITGTPE